MVLVHSTIHFLRGIYVLTHRGRKVIYFGGGGGGGGGAECKISVTTLACHLGGSGGMLPQENVGF